MKIEYGGGYDFDVTELDVGECEAIEKFCAVRGMGEWAAQLGVSNTRALQALWWVVRRHAGEAPGPVAQRDPGFRPLAFSKAYALAEKAEEAQAAEKSEEDQAAGPGEADEDPTTPAAG